MVERRGGGAAAFWTLGAVFLLAMSFTTIPTPLYAAFERQDGFPSWVVTVVFAAYAVGVAVALVLVGHLGDVLGRRPVAVAAIAAELVAAVLFLAAPQLPGLLVARFVSGVGIGALTASATAQLSELHDRWRGPGALPGAVATVANIGGLGLGPLVAGVLAVAAPAPLVLPFVVYVVALVAAGVAALLVPETVDRPDPLPPYRPQRVAVAPEARGGFLAAGAAVFAGFSVFGLFGAVTPTVMARIFGVPSPLAIGAVTWSVFTAGALAQLAFLKASLRASLISAMVAIAAGLAALGVAPMLRALPLFVIGGIVAGAGVGLVFRACLGLVGSMAPEERRGETLAGLFLLAYLGLIVPVLAVGGALAALPPVPVLGVFAVAVAALVVVAGVRLERRAAG
ncbi:MFS transporter [Amnibacterium sp.]|uniref:MFS transporter n=1 Tax=Amnibacterium sp. TaxID=1872496 RepID=UPI00260F8D35|nr:MFS transporter [Amnibacterium sp.]MCU1472469.1 mdfA [Amnibacterium sp.]